MKKTKKIGPLPKQIDLTIRSEVLARRVLWGVILFEIILILLDVFLGYFYWATVPEIRKMIIITREESLATWFSSTQMIVVGILLLLIAMAIKKQGNWQDVKRRSYGWLIIGFFFIYMGIDDAIEFHEGMGTYINISLKNSGKPGLLTSIWSVFPSYYWQLVFGPFFAVMGLFILYFLWKEIQSQTLRIWIVSALGMFVLAVGLDFIEGFQSNTYFGITDFFGIELHTAIHIFQVLEEFLEMLGTSFFLFVFLKHLFSQATFWKVEVK